MTKDEFSLLLTRIQSEEVEVREEGQKEYAHDDNNVFANFEDAANSLGGTREEDLMHLAQKHWRGICAYVKGHRSQREDIRGRIKDLRMYLALLWGMVEESESDNIPDGMNRAREEEKLFNTGKSLAEVEDLAFNSKIHCPRCESFNLSYKDSNRFVVTCKNCHTDHSIRDLEMINRHQNIQNRIRIRKE